ncbi:MAG: protein translocase subunit SecD [Phycisphaeraceae bacterium]
MNKQPTWKPILILVVIALCVLSLIQNGVKPGMDLAGGFVLTYEVKVPPGQDATTAIEQIRDVLSQRVDPTGVRNLVWRQAGGNRLEIQASLAPADVRVYRDAYIAAFDALREGNVTRFRVEGALKLPPNERDSMLNLIAGKSARRNELLAKLEKAHREMEKLRGPMTEALELAAKAEETFDKLPPESTQDQRDEAKKRAEEFRKAATVQLAAFTEAKNTFEPSMKAMLATNIPPSEIDRILKLPDIALEEKLDAGIAMTRGEAIAALKTEHPERAEQIAAVAEAHAAYDARRGPLDDPEDLIALLRGSGVLEFRIAARDTGAYQEYRERLQKQGPLAGDSSSYRWFVIDEVKQFAETEDARKRLHADPAGYFRSYQSSQAPPAPGLVGERYGDKYYILLSDSPNSRLTAAEHGWRVTQAFEDRDSSGFPAIGFTMNTVGAQNLSSLTSNYGPTDDRPGFPMAIVLDGRVMTTPTLQATISSRGIITGKFSQSEIKYLVRTLNAGSLKASLSDRPISTKFFNPEMGQDNLNRGKNAVIWSMVVICVFMALWYLWSGLVADFALLFNIVIILGVMSMLQANFTLPGIAGIVLVIGMAVDANVLIFERVREELGRNADVKTALRLGYDRAFVTIVDSNITTLITCVILAYFATVEVKGFAVALGIGIVASMFTAVFVTRVFFNYWVEWSNPKKISMLPTVLPKLGKILHPNISWTKSFKVMGGISAVLCVLSLVLVFSRGVDLLDIEFRSGTQVSFKVAPGKELTLAEARKQLTDTAEKLEAARKARGLDAKAAEMPWLRGTSASVIAIGDTTAQGKVKEFSVAVLSEDNELVSESIAEAFKAQLTVNRPIHFKGAPAGGTINEPGAVTVPENVYPIVSDNLGESINRTTGENVSDYIGGVAIVMEELSPPSTVDHLAGRINRQRNQPAYEKYSGREVRVIGLTPAANQTEGEREGANDKGTLYSGVVVVITDRATNYADNVQSFKNPDGLAGSEWKLVIDALTRENVFESVQNFSSQVSGTMKRQAIISLLLSLLAIGAYIWFRFGSLRYSLGAIAALAHDVTITLGAVALAHYLYDGFLGSIFGLSDFKIDLAMVAAILTIVGYSLNDTIVVYDRIRENRGRLAHATPDMINDSVNQTISRTLLTSGTTILASLMLYVLGGSGSGIHGFAFAMVVGVLIGTYSSIGIAANLLLIGKPYEKPEIIKATTAKG